LYEAYEYQITQYNPETDEGGLFVDYKNPFLKLKAEASGYPTRYEAPKREIFIRFGRVKELN